MHRIFLRGALLFPNVGFCINCGPPGGCPLGRGTPSSRSSPEESSPSTTRQAGQGASGPKGHPRRSPPHQLCRRAFVGKVSGIGLKPALSRHGQAKEEPAKFEETRSEEHTSELQSLRH